MAKMKENDKQIAREIILSQVASDGGKGIPTLRHVFKAAYQVWQAGYAAKDQHIAKAISLIKESRESDFRFSVIDSPDFGGTRITYFEWNGTLQVSFHSYVAHLKRWATNKRRPMVWDGDRGGSRRSCLILRDLMRGGDYNI